MKFVSIPYNDFIYEIFIYEMLCEIFVREIPDLYPKKFFVYSNNTDPKSIVNSARIVLFT